MKKKHEQELKPYADSLKSLLELNDACGGCEGTGNVFRRSCAEDEGDYFTCPLCNGSGIQVKVKGDTYDTSTYACGTSPTPNNP